MKINPQYRAFREIKELGISEGILPPRCFDEKVGLIYYIYCILLAFPLIFISARYLAGIL